MSEELKEIYRLDKVPMRDLVPGDVIYVKDDNRFMVVSGSPFQTKSTDDVPGTWGCEAVLCGDAKAALDRNILLYG